MYTSPTTTDGYLSTPGEILKEEFMQPLKWNVHDLAKAIGVSDTDINEIVNGKQDITTSMARLLAEVFNTTPKFWTNLQRDYKLLSSTRAGSVASTRS